jgi:hypothetical protein
VIITCYVPTRTRSLIREIAPLCLVTGIELSRADSLGNNYGCWMSNPEVSLFLNGFDSEPRKTTSNLRWFHTWNDHNNA